MFVGVDGRRDRRLENRAAAGPVRVRHVGSNGGGRFYCKGWSAMATSLETFTAGAETAVDVARIERQLCELWQLAAESEKDPARRQVTRASLFNLMSYSETDTAREHATEVISRLTSRHPCRAIVLLAPL